MKKYLVGLGILGLFTGCGYDYYNRGIVVKGNNYYKIPYGTRYGVVDSHKELPRFKYIYCNAGDVTFIDKEYAEKEIESVDDYKDKGIVTDEFDKFYKMMAKEGRIGCLPPLTETEYKFALRNENIQRNKEEKAFDSLIKQMEYKPTSNYIHNK